MFSESKASLFAVGTLTTNERGRDPRPTALLEEILDASTTIAGSDFGCIQIVHAESSRLEVVARRNVPSRWMDTWERTSEDVFDAVSKSARCVVVEKISNGVLRSVAEPTGGAQAFHSTPITSAGGEVIGMISIFHRKRHRPAEHVLKLLDVLAHQAGNVIVGMESSLRSSTESLARETVALGRENAVLEQFRHLVDAVKEYVICKLDPQGNVVTWNQGAQRIMGYEAREIVGQHFSRFYPPEDVAAGKCDRELETAVLQGRFEESGWRVRKDGTRFWGSSVISPILERGMLIGFAKVTRDETEREEMRARLTLADRMVSVGMLAAGVAHEINNPLAAVITNLGLAVRDIQELGQNVSLPPDLEAELEDARSSAERIRIIVRDLKGFSRGADDRRETVDVERVLESTLRMAWNEIRHRARLIKEYAHVRPVEANEARLGQVFLNLLVNAAQAMPEGSADRNVLRVSTSETPSGRVLVRISDTGSGIPPEVRDRLFTPFFTTKPVGVGTGLGLSICRGIVTSFGGEISFESEVGKGTEFRVELPVSTVEHDVPAQAVSTEPGVGRRGRVLVIDDERLVTNAVRRVLSREHDVVVTMDAAEALALFQRGERFDVVLCDLLMPRLTGMDLHAQVALLDQVQASRFVFTTGGAFTPRAMEFLQVSGNHRIEKPFDIGELRRIVNDLVR